MRQITAHKLVLETAQKMAHELYDEVMSGSNEMYRGWKERCDAGELTREEGEKLFVQLIAPKLLEPARAILAHMLSDNSLSHLHSEIYEAMLLDNAIRAARVTPAGRARLDIAEDGSVTTMRTRH